MGLIGHIRLIGLIAAPVRLTCASARRIRCPRDNITSRRHSSIERRSDDTRRRDVGGRRTRVAAIAGDEAAWRALYDRHFDSLYGYLYWRAGRHPQRTEEVVQECWAVVVKRIRRFDPSRAPFHAWLRGIADKTLLNHRRRWQRRDHTELPNAAYASTSTAQLTEAQWDVGAISPNHTIELTEHIGLALTALPPKHQAVLRAKYEEGASVAEIAERWETTPKAVESLLTRARAAFQEEYQRLDNDR